MSEKTTAVAVAQPNNGLDMFAQPGEVITVPREGRQVRGLEADNLRPGDKGALPRGGLSHKLNPDKNRQPGHWYETATNTCIKNPEVVFLMELKERGQILWPEVYDPSNKPVCYSDGYADENGMVWPEPAGSELRPMTDRRPGPCYIPGQPNDCCPDAQWTRVKDGDDKAPRCKYMRKWVVAMFLHDPDRIEVVQMQFHGTALKEIKSLTNKLLRVGLTQSFVLGARYSTDGRDYWIPTFADGRKLNDAGIIHMDNLADMYEAEFESGALRAATSIELDDEDAIDGEYTTSEPEIEEDAIPF